MDCIILCTHIHVARSTFDVTRHGYINRRPTNLTCRLTYFRIRLLSILIAVVYLFFFERRKVIHFWRVKFLRGQKKNVPRSPSRPILFTQLIKHDCRLFGSAIRRRATYRNSLLNNNNIYGQSYLVFQPHRLLLFSLCTQYTVVYFNVHMPMTVIGSKRVYLYI